MFKLKNYQERTLEALELFYIRCAEYSTPKLAFASAFQELTGNSKPYHAVPGFPEEMPYVCLRLPTGGGKTMLGGFTVGLTAQRLLHLEHSLVLWLVPSRAILEQTMQVLKDREGPLRRGLEEGWGRWPGVGKVSVMDLEEARSISRATLDTETVIVVATAQAFRQESTDILKVYESSGALMPHFTGLTDQLEKNLRHGPEGNLLYSLENVFRLRRPLVIVDEAHNARSDLSFETLNRLRPSCIVELTATPATKGTPSNVLHSVSAAELKDEEMVKLPIQLETQRSWQELLAAAIARRGDLAEHANQEHAAGGEYVRPLVLIQAQPRREGQDKLDVEALKLELVNNHHIPETEIAIATGETKELEGLNLFAKECPINYIITQKALAEGWDCSFAYVLVSVAELKSETAVEQLLGRILRMPYAKSRQTPALNRAYAFVASASFRSVAETLRDALVNIAGFEKKDAAQYITAAKTEQKTLGISCIDHKGAVAPVVIELAEKPELAKLPDAIKEKIEWKPKTQTLTIIAPLTKDEEESLTGLMVMEATQAQVQKANQQIKAQIQQIIELAKSPAEKGLDFRVPQMSIHVQGEWQLFDEPEVLDYPWTLPLGQAIPGPEDLAALNLLSKLAQGGTLDVTESGQIVVKAIPELQNELKLVYTPEHVTETKLAGWLCKNLIDPYTDQPSLMAFISQWLRDLISRDDFSLVEANALKFSLRQALAEKFREMRKEAKRQAFQNLLFPLEGVTKARVGENYLFEFHPDHYSPNGIFPRSNEMNHHYYPVVGEFDSEDEKKMAWHLESLCDQGILAFWVRNLVRKGHASFFLQKATDRFYPDFLAKLPNGRIIVIECKGDYGWKAAEDDRRIGDLWESLSEGKCLFVMVKDGQTAMLDAKLA